MICIDTKYFHIYYAKEDCSILDQIINVVDGMYERVISFFELSKSIKSFTFYLCPDVRTYKIYAKKSDEEYQVWMVGNADYSNQVLCILSPRVVKDRSFESMMKVIQHEIIHIAFGELETADNVGICVAEGIAVAFAEQINVPSLDLDYYPNLLDLMDEENFYENDGYNYAGAYILYFLSKYGKDIFKNIYSGKDELEKYIYPGFEKEAILHIKSQCLL